MSVLMSVISFPVGAVKWIYNLAKAGELRMRLQKERQTLHKLKEQHDIQLSALKTGTSTFVKIGFESIHFEISAAKQEPYVHVNCNLFNGSMFHLELSGLRFNADLNGYNLPLAATLVTDAKRIAAGNMSLLTFRQPIATNTRDSLLSAIQTHDRLNWKFTLTAHCTVEDTKDEFKCTHIVTHEHIPFGR